MSIVRKQARPFFVVTFLKWASHSMVGHVVMMLVCVSIPSFAVLVGLDRADGRLTLFRALYSAVLVSAGGAVGAVIFWYAVSSPLIERQRKRSR
jgi:hypothetical protein